MERLEIFAIESTKVEPPWGQELDLFTKFSLTALTQAAATFGGEISGLQRAKLYHRAFILHWLTRLKWDSSHKIPVPRGERDTYKPLGELYVAVLDLCMEVHLVAPNRYSTAAEWFRYVLIEGAFEGTNTNSGKDSDLKLLQHQNRMLSDLDNPIDQATHPHTWELINTSIQIANRSDLFRKLTYRSLVRARQAWAKDFASTKWHSLRFDEGKAFIQQGKGRNRQELKPVKLSRGRNAS